MKIRYYVINMDGHFFRIRIEIAPEANMAEYMRKVRDRIMLAHLFGNVESFYLMDSREEYISIYANEAKKAAERWCAMPEKTWPYSPL